MTSERRLSDVFTSPTLDGLRSRARAWLPAMLVAGYLTVTSCMYLSLVLGDSTAPSVGRTAIFSLSATVAVLVGYALGRRRELSRTSRDRRRPGRSDPVPPLHLILLVCACLWWVLFGTVSMVNRGIEGPSDMVVRILDPRSSYYAKFDEASGGVVTPILQILNLSGVFYWLLIPLTVLYWSRLELWLKVAAIAGVLSYLLLFLSTGTQKGVADVVIQLGVCVVAVMIARGTLRLRHVLVMGAGAICAVILMATSLGLRTDATSTIMQQGTNAEHAELLQPLIGESAARGSVILRDYATQGYRGLGYSLELPFEWTYGIGSMRSLSSYLPQYFGSADPFYRTYPARVEAEFGWSSTEQWSTVYPWLASDISFPGVLILTALVGFVLARAARAVRRRGDALSLVGLSMMSIYFVFAPANNQLFNDRYSALGVLALALVAALRSLRQYLPPVLYVNALADRVSGYLVRNSLRWRSRIFLALINRLSRRRVVSPEGVALAVSMTTFGTRLKSAHVSLESIARGSVRPVRLILWVDEEQYDEANRLGPLRRLVARGLEIKKAESALGPHKKYYAYVQAHGSDDLPLVLADDDIVYPRSWLEELFAAFEEESGESIVSWWVKRYSLSESAGLVPYVHWPSVEDSTLAPDHYLMGGSGTVLPRRMLAELQRAGMEFMECTPRADDIWLNLVAVRSGILVRQVRDTHLRIITVPMTQRNKLSHENVTGNLNDVRLGECFTVADLELLVQPAVRP